MNATYPLINFRLCDGTHASVYVGDQQTVYIRYQLTNGTNCIDAYTEKVSGSKFIKGLATIH